MATLGTVNKFGQPVKLEASLQSISVGPDTQSGHVHLSLGPFQNEFLLEHTHIFHIFLQSQVYIITHKYKKTQNNDPGVLTSLIAKQQRKIDNIMTKILSYLGVSEDVSSSYDNIISIINTNNITVPNKFDDLGKILECLIYSKKLSLNNLVQSQIQIDNLLNDVKHVSEKAIFKTLMSKDLTTIYEYLRSLIPLSA
jgi:hypothetical protein